MKRKYSQRKLLGFTLLEMMIVMAIITLIAGMLFAGIRAVIIQGKKAKAASTVSMVAAASRAYYAEYGLWPGSTGTPIVNSGTILVNCLRGTDLVQNPRAISFMDFAGSDLKGTGTLQVLCDPFGAQGSNTFLPYSVYFDLNNDGVVSLADGGSPLPNLASITGGVAVWSWGTDRINQWGTHSTDIANWK
jgi:prepilin-type N-terminal cleavage/methylation domain-containing protein